MYTITSDLCDYLLTIPQTQEEEQTWKPASCNRLVGANKELMSIWDVILSLSLQRRSGSDIKDTERLGYERRGYAHRDKREETLKERRRAAAPSALYYGSNYLLFMGFSIYF